MDDLIILMNSEAVQSAGYKFIGLTLDKEVSVTLPPLVARISNLCSRWKGVRVLVIWTPRT